MFILSKGIETLLIWRLFYNHFLTQFFLVRHLGSPRATIVSVSVCSSVRVWHV